MSISGIGVSPGSAHGRAVVVSTVKITPPGERTDDPAAATEAVTAALGAVAAEMEVRAAKATEKAKPVLEATAMLARDPSLLSTATGRIAEGEGPVDALYFAIEQYCELLASLGGYMAERQDDLRDIFQRAAAELLGVAPPGVPELTEPRVIVAHDLAPADTATLDRIEGEGRVAFRYADSVNGSARAIAGVLNDAGNVLGMMPHPERAIEAAHGGSDGRRLFASALGALVGA